MANILVIDDEEAVCWALAKALKAEGHQVSISASAEDALEKARKNSFDAVILDVRLPGMDGLTALPTLKERTHDAPVIVITAFGNLPTAVRAVEGGAFDYLAKPFDLNQALETVQRALEQRRQQTLAQVKPVETVETPGEMVGVSAAMQGVFKRIAMVAPRNACVLITGESGTGKELVARALQRYSRRSEQPFLSIHVAALNPSLVESELFGHVKGAFTGATESRTGQLVLMNGGTVFFDEVAEIPLPVQVKLLRVLENKEVIPVGANQPIHVDLRILAATHQDLERKVADGSFRHDLYYRLNVFQIHLLPLRERREDILPLAEHFLRELDPRMLPLLSTTSSYLMARDWIGNVRELRNALEHAVIVSRGGPLLPEHFPPEKSTRSATEDGHLATALRRWLDEKIAAAGPEGPRDLYVDLLAKVEPPVLEELLRRLQGHRAAAAQWLGLNRATLRKKLTQYGLAEPSRGDEESDEVG